MSLLSKIGAGIKKTAKKIDAKVFDPIRSSTVVQGGLNIVLPGSGTLLAKADKAIDGLMGRSALPASFKGDMGTVLQIAGLGSNTSATIAAVAESVVNTGSSKNNIPDQEQAVYDKTSEYSATDNIVEGGFLGEVKIFGKKIKKLWIYIVVLLILSGIVYLVVKKKGGKRWRR